MAGVKGKSGAMSVVLDRGGGTQEIMVTALGAEEARKARALLEVRGSVGWEMVVVGFNHRMLTYTYIHETQKRNRCT